ncbi:MAG: MFS transporter [Actinomycetota bacterium]
MLAPLLGVIAVGLDADLVAVGVAVALFEAAGLVSPLSGWLIDRIGPPRVALVGLALFASASFGAAGSPNVVVLAIALAGAGVSSNLVESAATVWVSARSSFAERATWLGRLDLAWPAGLLIGLPIAGGLSLISWRLAFVAVSAVALGSCLRLAAFSEHTASPVERATTGWTWASVRSGRSTIIAFASIAAAIQLVIVSFGVWLGDVHGLSTAAIGAVGFGLGVADLTASVLNIRITDRIGKSSAATIGATVMVAAVVALAASNSLLIVGALALALAIAAHEFALLATKPLLAEIDPEHPGLGIGLGFGAAAGGRGAAAIGGTWLYTVGGMTHVALGAAAIGLLAAVVYATSVRDPETRGARP